MFIDAGSLFNIAKDAYKRTKKASSERDTGQTDALVSVVFSCVSLEAFINEAIELAGQPSPYGKPPNPNTVLDFFSIAKEVEYGWRTTELKFLLAKRIFTGTTYNKGENPYQDFALLWKLRNDLVHLKSLDKFEKSSEGVLIVKSAKIIEDLRSKNIIAEFKDKNTITSWTNLISTRAVARWACNTASEVVQSVLNFVPESWYKQQLDLFYKKSFQPIKD